jgi:hypothetical protein
MSFTMKLVQYCSLSDILVCQVRRLEAGPDKQDMVWCSAAVNAFAPKNVSSDEAGCRLNLCLREYPQHDKMFP